MVTLLPTLLAQDNGDAAAAGGALALLAGMGACYFIFIAVFVIAIIAGFWKTFEKAGKPGWAAIVPIYNFIVLLDLVFAVLLGIDVAKSFGKGVGLGLLPFIFYPILGFGSAKYLGPQPSSM